MRIVLLTLALALTLGCSTQPSKTLISKLDGATVEIRIHRSKPASAMRPGTLVYGRVSITGPKKIASANLKCIALQYGDRSSQKAYVDSMASVSTDAFQATNGKVDVNMYWYFAGLDLQDFDPSRATIQIIRKDGSCIKYVSGRKS